MEGCRPGFASIELLVVVVIISLLLAVLLPNLSRAKEQARAVQCPAHLRDFGHGMPIYYDEWGNYPGQQWRLPDNALWSGPGLDPSCDPKAPDFDLDAHVDYEYLPIGRQEWRY